MKVIVSPHFGAERERLEENLRRYAAQRKLGDIEIVHSRIPYRAA
jgi:hypothetical protein